MEERFLEYLATIGISTAPLLEKVQAAIKSCQFFCPEEIRDIFVNDYIKEDGTREYTDLECFCEGYLVSANSFITGGEFQLQSISRKVRGIHFNANDYDLNEAKQESRLSVEIYIGTETIWQCQASKENCDYLRDLVAKYIKPNLDR